MVAMAEERLLTVEEVAERLQVSEWTIRDWLRSGRLKGSRMGGRKLGWRIRPAELDRFITESEQRPE
jgi:excisionase family DNA binding protein